jgi:uncharacterized protein (DUF1778 family)
MLQTNDKRNRITLRLNDAQFSFIKAAAEVLGVSPSEFLRMMVNASMVSARKDDKFKEVLGRANDKTDSND